MPQFSAKINLFCDYNRKTFRQFILLRIARQKVRVKRPVRFYRTNPHVQHVPKARRNFTHQAAGAREQAGPATWQNPLLLHRETVLARGLRIVHGTVGALDEGLRVQVLDPLLVVGTDAEGDPHAFVDFDGRNRPQDAPSCR